MPQKTLVVHVPSDQCAALEARFVGEAFEFRSVPHARFSVKGGGAVATLYNAGAYDSPLAKRCLDYTRNIFKKASGFN